MAIVISCDQCNSYANAPAVINTFSSINSNTTQGKSGILKYNVQNFSSLKIEADYNKDWKISNNEIDEIIDYKNGDATFTTRILDKIGDIEFKLIVTGNDGEVINAKTTASVIAHVLPDFSSSDFSGIEGKTLTFELPTVEGVEYTTISVSNDNYKIISSTLDKAANKFTVKISGDVTEQGSYDVQFGYNIPETGITGTISKPGNIISNLCRIQGRLEIAREPGMLKPGEVRGYDEADMNNESNYIGRKVTNDGLVDIIMSNPADSISLQGLVTGDRSYLAKISLDGKKDYLANNGELAFDDNGNVINNGQVTLRPNYYAASHTAEDLRYIVKKTNSITEIAPDGKQYGITIPDLNIEVIEILKKNPYSGVVFTTSQQQAIANVYLNNTDFKNVFGMEDLSNLVQIDGDDNTPPNGKLNHFNVTGIYTNPNVRCRVIVPSNSVTAAGTAQYYKNGTILSGVADRIRIELNPSVTSNVNLAAILIHEDLGHGIFSFWAHVPDAYGDDSIVAVSTRLTQYGGIDYAITDAVKNKAFPKRSPLNKTHALTWGAYEEL